jgi:short-subunit dehydrogenase
MARVDNDTGGTVLVTGASSGIGYELTKCFAADGWDSIVVSRREERLAEVSEELRETYGVNAHVFTKDLAQAGAAQSLYEQVTDAGFEIDALVNNAGYGSYGSFLEDELETDRELIALHATTPTILSKLFGRDMAARGGGRILNNASIAGWAPSPKSAVYSAAKHYERAFSEAIADELSDERITVTVLCPGETETGFFKRGGYGDSGSADADMMTATEVAEAGYEGLMAGERIVIPGLVNKFRVFLRRILPRSLYLKAVKQSLSK